MGVSYLLMLFEQAIDRKLLRFFVVYRGGEDCRVNVVFRVVEAQFFTNLSMRVVLTEYNNFAFFDVR